MLGIDFGVQILQFSLVRMLFLPDGSKRFNVEAQKSRSEDDVDSSDEGVGQRLHRRESVG